MKCDKIPIYEEDIVDVEVRLTFIPTILKIFVSRFARIPPGLCAETQMFSSLS